VPSRDRIFRSMLRRPTLEATRMEICVVVHVVIQARLVAETGWKLASEPSKQAQNPRKRTRWTKPRRFRDREAPGSNPGPPTKSEFRFIATAKLM
jgi:hypothetical protein